MVATERSAMYHVVAVKVNNITCRALIGTGSVSSYASTAFLEKLNVQPVKKVKRIEMMMCTK